LKSSLTNPLLAAPVAAGAGVSGFLALLSAQALAIAGFSGISGLVLFFIVPPVGVLLLIVAVMFLFLFFVGLFGSAGTAAATTAAGMFLSATPRRANEDGSPPPSGPYSYPQQSLKSPRKFNLALIVAAVLAAVVLAAIFRGSNSKSSGAGTEDVATSSLSGGGGTPQNHRSLSETERQTLRRERQNAVDFVAAIDGIRKSSSFTEQVEKYCRFTAEQEEKLFETHTGGYQCQATYLNGLKPFPSDQWFMEKASGWQARIADIDHKLADENHRVPVTAPSEALESSSAASNSAPESAGCLQYDVPVRLKGRIEEETFPGPPNYESIAKGDKPEAFWILSLDSPVCTVQNDALEERHESNVQRVQLLVEPDMYGRYRSLLMNPLIVTGKLTPGENAHHHTGVLLSVSKVDQ
jgi:hypothetical protein